jgi:alpha-ketoglutarate-dependent taurine dioxygenase
MRGPNLSVTPLDATFGAVVTDIELARIDDTTFSELHTAWLEYALLIFPGQHLDREDQVNFARRFGDLEIEYAPISNVRRDGTLRPDDDSDDVIKILKGNMGWHADSTYMPVQAKGAVFTAEVVPSGGGETGWADMRAAFDALEPEVRDRLSSLSSYHSLHYSQSRLGHSHSKDSDYSGYGFHDEPPPLRPMVKIHPETGRSSLLIGRHAFGIPGLSPAESEDLLDELVDHACCPPRVYHHQWTRGDTVLWDNRCLLHRACPWDMSEPRVMYHTRIAGDPATESVQPN